MRCRTVTAAPTMCSAAACQTPSATRPGQAPAPLQVAQKADLPLCHVQNRESGHELQRAISLPQQHVKTPAAAPLAKRQHLRTPASCAEG